MNENQGIVRYREFLVARHGEVDLLRHSLSKRAAFFDDLARSPVRSSAPIDRASYFRNMARRRIEPGLEPRMLWILATAKANPAERFGVGIAELLGRVNGDDPARVHVTLQETYHTRMLAVVAMRCATRASSCSPTSPRSPSASGSSTTRSCPTKSATSDSSRRGSTSMVAR